MNVKLIEEKRIQEIQQKLDNLYKLIEGKLETGLLPMFKKWIDNQDVCNLLKISKRTLQNYRDNGTLPFSNIEGKIFYKASDIDDHLERNYRKAS